MNKKQEALRRGLRSFIEDTSRELADLEGRALPPSPGAVVRADEIVRAIEAEEPTPRPVVRRRAAASQAVASRAREALVEPAPAATPPPAADQAPHEALPPVAPTIREDDVREDDLRDDDMSARPSESRMPPPIRAAEPPLADSRPRVSPPGTTRDALDGTSPVVDRPARSRRRTPSPARRRPHPRVAAEIASNGVSAEQAHARKGVCFAYFLNHECWRVPDAYCTTALQVCITRECPVYHLHKDALERRFARKFKHFW